MNLGSFFALFRAPEDDEAVQRLEEERSALELDLRKKMIRTEAELDELIEKTAGARDVAKSGCNQLEQTMKSLRLVPSTPDVREKLPSNPDPETA